MTKSQKPAYASIPKHTPDGVATGEVWPQSVAISTVDKSPTTADELSVGSSGPNAMAFLGHAFDTAIVMWSEAIRIPLRREPTN